MNLIETETCQSIIDRLKQYIPASMSGSVLPYLDRPEEMTEDILTAVHPKGLYLVQFIESTAAGMEQMIFGVYTVAKGLSQTSKLTRAAKLIVTGLQPSGTHRLELHEDKPVVEEGGIIMRCVSFRLNAPAVKPQESALTAAITELNI